MTPRRSSPITVRACGSTSCRALRPGRRPQGLVEQGVVGVTSNPTIFQGAIAEGDAYDDQIRELSPRRERAKEIFWRSPGTTSATPATSCAPSATRATARTATSRSRSIRTSRTTPQKTKRGGQAPARPGRPPEPVHQDPRHDRGPAGDRGDDRRRHPRQRDADLLARAPPQGRRGLHPRPPALRRRRRRPGRSPPSRRSSSRASTPRPTSASTRRRPRRAQGQARDRQRQARLPDLQGGLLGRAVGGAGGQGRDQAALPVGVDLDQEPGLPRRDLRRGARRARHRQHDAARHGRGRPRPRRDPRHSLEEDVEERPQAARRPRGRRGRLRRRRRDAREGGRKKFADSFDELFEAHRVQAHQLVAA